MRIAEISKDSSAALAAFRKKMEEAMEWEALLNIEETKQVQDSQVIRPSQQGS